MIDISAIHLAIKQKDTSSLVMLLKKYQLKIVDNKIVISDDQIKELYDYWDKRQLVRKILLNSALMRGAFN
jgi:hypothetical protein